MKVTIEKLYLEKNFNGVSILEEIIEAGRGRWKIENEGFNNQKTGSTR